MSETDLIFKIVLALASLGVGAILGRFMAIRIIKNAQQEHP